MTPQQAKIYALIRNLDVCPSYQEMAKALGVRSKSGIGRIIHDMEEAGLIRRRKGGSRNLEVVDRNNPPWMPIETAPRDGTHFLATILVRNIKTGKSWWETYVIWADDETQEVHNDCDHGWTQIDDYSYWMPLPDDPDARAIKILEEK